MYIKKNAAPIRNVKFLLILALVMFMAPSWGCGKQTIATGEPEQSGSSQSTSGGSTSPGGYSGSTSSGSGSTAPRGTKPYTVLGKTYHPLLSSEGFYEEGIASWYGKDFHGKQTANGERYDMYGMTAAHKLLPFGTVVRVTNQQNGKSVQVRINDRGPFVDNRVIDLTHSAASQLDMLSAGTAPVTINTIGAVKGLAQGKLTGNFYVQIGAFTVEANASKLLQSMRGRGYPARSTYVQSIGFWRVQLGPYNDLAQAESMADSLKGEFERNFVVAD